MSMLSRIPIWIFLIVAFICLAFVLNNDKRIIIKGLSLEAPSQSFEAEIFDDFHRINADWVALMPYAFTPENTTELHFDLDRYQWWGERTDGIEASIEMAQEKGLRVMLKPHLWISHGSFTGDLNYESDEDWSDWEKGYQNYIITYAKLAEKHEVELFCLGTELKTFVNERPEFWDRLIEEVDQVYSGKITYAANWDNYGNIPFWESLDFVGIDAYFPLSNKENPTVNQLTSAWEPWIKEMNKLADRVEKPILFTEYGYLSTTYNCKAPWTDPDQCLINEDAQVHAYEALYQSLWSKDWFSGGFIWKWHAPSNYDKDRKRGRYTPQNKSTEEVIKNWYGKD